MNLLKFSPLILRCKLREKFNLNNKCPGGKSFCIKLRDISQESVN